MRRKKKKDWRCLGILRRRGLLLRSPDFSSGFYVSVPTELSALLFGVL